MANAIRSRCRHYLSYSGVSLPLKLVTPLAPEQIVNRNTYFRGCFDDQDRLIGVQKIVYGETEFEHRYQYDSAGVLRRAEIRDAEGEVSILRFDAEGQRRPD